MAERLILLSVLFFLATAGVVIAPKIETLMVYCDRFRYRGHHTFVATTGWAWMR